MSTEQHLSNEKSLAIIHQMINQAKNNISDSGLSWLLWGVALFLTSVSTYIFIDIGSDNIFLGWNIFGIVTILLLSYEIFRPKKKSVRTYLDDILRLVDIGFIVCLFIIIFSINYSVGPNNGFGFMLMIFAFLMLVKGGAIKSKALIVGAVVNWAAAIAVIVNTEFRYDMLIMAAAVLIGYIIPGLLLRAQHKRNSIK